MNLMALRRLADVRLLIDWHQTHKAHRNRSIVTAVTAVILP